MSEISASDVMALRRKTGAGVVQCRNALQTCNGDVARAEERLRAESRERAGAKMGREAGEGGVALAIDGLRGALIEINTETDFAARTEEFCALARDIAGLALEQGSDVNALLSANYPGAGVNVEEQIQEIAGGTIRENLRLRRSGVLRASSGAVVGYVHNKINDDIGRLAALVAVESSAPSESLAIIGKQLAMHVAANAPCNVEEMANQDFVMNTKISVAKALGDASRDIGAEVQLSGFLRFALAEPIDDDS